MNFTPIFFLCILFTLSCSKSEKQNNPASDASKDIVTKDGGTKVRTDVGKDGISHDVKDSASDLNLGTDASSENKKLAAIVGVKSTQNGDNYSFQVTIKSPDTGCEQYANWWEVLSEDGKLIYRRILGHSHTKEQPFTRSGGPVEIKANTSIWIRAHMNNSGYGTKVFKGSVKNGFKAATLSADFAKELDNETPSCAF